MRSFKVMSIISYGSVLALAGVPQFASAAAAVAIADRQSRHRSGSL
jgi:hypothetical protein